MLFEYYLLSIVKKVESVPFIAIYLFGIIFSVPVLIIVNSAPAFKYITPSLVFLDESCKLEIPDKVKETLQFSLSFCF